MNNWFKLTVCGIILAHGVKETCDETARMMRKQDYGKCHVEPMTQQDIDALTNKAWM